MVSVYFPEEHKPLIDLLIERREETGSPTFPTMMHLMCFAAMVGYSESREGFQERTFRKGSEIKSEIFDGDGKDGLAYLLAMQETGSGEILREGKESDCYIFLEHYASIGLQIIDSWTSNNPTDVDGIETLLNQMKNEAHLRLDEEGKDGAPINPKI